jgi:Putative peptidoglycan binding domain
VFLRPGGAQVDLPQVYWKQIGGSVDAVSAHALAHNRIYGAPIAPIGQTYGAPSADDLRRFRQVWAGWGAPGLSWWSWQETDAAHWGVLAEPAPAPAPAPDPGWPALGKGARGDEVIWLQEHVTSAYPAVTVTGRYDAATAAGVSQLQAAAGIPVTGTTDASTWQVALALPLTATDWAAKGDPTAVAAASRRREIPRADAPAETPPGELAGD